GQGLVRPAAGVVDALKTEPAARWPQDAADHIEQRRLAGAIGPDQRMHLAFGDLARRLVQRGVAPEPAGYPIHVQERGHDLRSRGAGSSPSGRQIAIRTRIVPKIVMRQSCTTRSSSGNRVTMAAPTIDPKGLATPPSTTYRKVMAEREKSNWLASMNRA